MNLDGIGRRSRPETVQPVQVVLRSGVQHTYILESRLIVQVESMETNS